MISVIILFINPEGMDSMKILTAQMSCVFNECIQPLMFD